MSNLLWKYYLEADVERFRKLLAGSQSTSHYASKGHPSGAGGSGSMGATFGSPAIGFGTSPRAITKGRKSSGSGVGNATKNQNYILSRSDLNIRDRSGLTLLHRASSSTGTNSLSFALALTEHAMVDIYIQDTESGWTALHRALYFGNITVARALMDRDLKDCIGHGANSTIIRTNALIKIKDHEGNSAFDVYNATIVRRTLRHLGQSEKIADGEADDDDSVGPGGQEIDATLHSNIHCDEMFAFGSNKNLTLGFGDEDDRQHPERISLQRPDHLLYRFHREYLLSRSGAGEVLTDLQSVGLNSVSDLPALIRNRPIIIQDVALSKLHSAILTTDPESNLYICGFGPGGRLGTGDETTKFNYVCVEGGGLAGKKIVSIALGQNHSIAVSEQGEVFTWGSNNWGQLGYILPRPALQDEEPINCTPRQIFGPLKREVVIGVAASRIHSVAFTSTSLYIWGKNEGQLGLMDSDSRSLETQSVPRRVAASLFASPIQMVSAIDRATTCLLANHAVYVFTNYGYNNVKFPMYDEFSNYHLNNTALTTRYAAEPSHISSVTSGGETIAAVSCRGDLFTLNISQKLDSTPTPVSTTNPTKIRNALSQPQRVWSLRKGHWDGIKSVGVGENGSVIICTQAGAVWHRVRRPKIKNTYPSINGNSKSKDYKFQRVPGLTKVAAVRSNTFGAYAALRKDCDVTKTQITVNKQNLWADLAPLFSLQNLKASELRDNEEEVSRFWMPASSKGNVDSLKRAVLTSPDLETDVRNFLRNAAGDLEDYDVDVCTTLSATKIPIHGFMIAARSLVLRDALNDYRRHVNNNNSDIFSISGEKKLSVVFSGLDFLTILNLTLYAYTDKVVDVWHFTRHAPKSAFRYRQVRSELMKLASKLGIVKLESAVRLMSDPELHLNQDLTIAFDDPRFFEDGDAVIELNSGSIAVHSSLVRQRCPFFEGLFNGRAAGQWILGRREANSDIIRIDMKHIDPAVFKLILRYLYTDAGVELFDAIVSADIDEFSDVVMDVMSVANELMLERLSQICQQVIGRFVNTRNICQLVNAIAPCSVTEFKDAGLEYICLQLEAMLENYSLNELDQDLMLELDEVVRDNQLACLPFVKSGRSESLLHEQNPSLAGEIDEERQRKIRDMAFQNTIKEEDSRLSSSFRTRVGSIDYAILSSPSQEKLRRKFKPTRNAPFSPAMRPKDSTADLMFDMEDEDVGTLANSVSPRQGLLDLILKEDSRPVTPMASKDVWNGVKARDFSSMGKAPVKSPTTLLLPPMAMSPRTTTDLSIVGGPTSTNVPWSSAALPSSKLDMKEIMAQASRGRTSTLSISLSAEKAKADVAAAAKVIAPKMSQKERKKQQQQQQQQQQSVPQTSSTDQPSSSPRHMTPWQVPRAGPMLSLKDVLTAEASIPSTRLAKPSISPVAVIQKSRRTASPDTRFSGQQRINSNLQGRLGVTPPPNYGSLRVSPQLPAPKAVQLNPQSHPYLNPASKAEPALQLSMADIIVQQKREQDIIREAVVKRSLQEIQEEQAFQEWWDQESKRAQDEDATRATATAAVNGGNGNTRGKGRGSRGDAQKGEHQGGRNNNLHSSRKGRGGFFKDKTTAQQQDDKERAHTQLHIDAT